MTKTEIMKNTKIRISDTVHINDQEVVVGQTMAIGPVAPGFAGVTLTIFTEDFDVDWKKVPSDIEIIAPDEVIAQRAAEVENFAGGYIHGIPVDGHRRMSMTLRIDNHMSTPLSMLKALERMIELGVPHNADLGVETEGNQIRVSAVWEKANTNDE